MRDQMKKNKGFSLIELLIAVTLLSIIMIMVTQFMGTTSGALTKTRKNLNLQTEAMEVGTQISDSIVQATYIRVRTQDGTAYPLNNTLDSERKKRDPGTGKSITRDLVVDNYPNYLKAGETNRKIIVDEAAGYTLVDESKTRYPLADDEDSTSVQTFRNLTATGGPYYVKPEYIYLRYMEKVGGIEEEAYVIFHFTGKEIYMDRGKIADLSGADGFEDAVTKMSGAGSLLTEDLSDCYFSADADTNTVILDILFENERFKQYTYNYAETILLRNSNVLTVPPQKLYKVK